MLVIDASAAVDLVVPSSRTPVLRRLIYDSRLYAPHLMYSESLSALRRMERSQELTHLQADAAVRRLRDMPVQTAWSADWIDGAWSRREWLQMTDAVYAAAAERLDAPLLTTDRRLARALADRSINVIAV